MRSSRTGSSKRIFIRSAAILMMLMLSVTAVPVLSGRADVSAESVTETGITGPDEVNLRESPGTDSSSLAVLAPGTELTISSEVFISKDKTSADKIWYQVSAGGQSGFVRADLAIISAYSGLTGVTTDELNLRTGPATTFDIRGTVPGGAAVTLLATAIKLGNDDVWYKVEYNGTVAYISSNFVNVGAAAAAVPASEAAPAVEEDAPIQVDLTGRSELAVALLSNPTSGGSCRVVYTFDSKNCTRLIKVKGYKDNWVPQGMATNGLGYFIIFGMNNKQGIVTYSNSGVRIATSPFPFKMGHPNGITWDPVSGLCYIFKGNQRRYYTWNPATNTFGKASTPYSSSGIAFDSSTNLLYATSRTGIRVYSAGGGFVHQKLFARCKHSGTHYTQDCGAGGGFVFHGVSGSNKHKTNYLDIYRVADGKYLGSIKVNLGETESAVVDSEGYVELLINHSGTYDEYIWKTPLNINELM